MFGWEKKKLPMPQKLPRRKQKKRQHKEHFIF
jgi:hypothetical protein